MTIILHVECKDVVSERKRNKNLNKEKNFTYENHYPCSNLLKKYDLSCYGKYSKACSIIAHF